MMATSDMRVKKVLILGKRDEDPNVGYGSGLLLTNLLKEHFNSAEVEIESIFYDDLVFIFDGANTSITDPVSGCDLRDADFVFLRAWFKTHGEAAQSIAHYLAEHGVIFYNSEALYARSQTKLSQYTRLWRQRLPLPLTCYGSHENLLLQQSQPKPFLSYPLILKSINGARGKDNYLVNSYEELAGHLKDNLSVRFFIQEYIPNKSDFRVVMIKDRVVAVIERTRKNNSTHLNNVSQGAASKLHDTNSLSKDVVNECIKASGAFHREISGIDLIYNMETGDHFFLEHNNMPQIETSGSADHMVAELARLIASELSA